MLSLPLDLRLKTEVCAQIHITDLEDGMEHHSTR